MTTPKARTEEAGKGKVPAGGDPFVDVALTARLPDTLRGGVLALGNFDGVHRGHQAVIEAAVAEAKARGVPCYVLSFEPHPRSFFQPDVPVFRLTPHHTKAKVLEAFGVDGLLTLPFDAGLASTPAEDFVKQHLLDAAGACHVVTGFNFFFGAKRGGTPALLRSLGQQLGFGVTTVPAFNGLSQDAISSSRIRMALKETRTGEANALLGYRWQVSGTVVPGAQLGRTLGYPTANLKLPETATLAHGIYAVRFSRADGTVYDGVASFGRRPTFDNGAPLLETFVFDFSGDLYGETVTVSLFEWLRGEEAFDSAEDLIVQMDKDSEAARAVLDQAAPLSPLDAALNFFRPHTPADHAHAE
ncbi:MAG: bifunctional riboflavin kinase/FAD synthetase [Pseudomonadota bacterium]